jgi:hypothetical protein
VAHFPRFVVIGVITATMVVFSTAAVRPVLFEWLLPLLRTAAGDERTALIAQIGLYFVFATMLLIISVAADFTRIFALVHRAGVGRAFACTGRYMRGQAARVAVLSAALGAVALTLLLAYAAVEYFGGTRVGGWRALLIGQLYIGARIVLRLSFAAAAVKLVRETTGGSSSRHSTS